MRGRVYSGRRVRVGFVILKLALFEMYLRKQIRIQIAIFEFPLYRFLATYFASMTQIVSVEVSLLRSTFCRKEAKGSRYFR